MVLSFRRATPIVVSGVQYLAKHVPEGSVLHDVYDAGISLLSRFRTVSSSVSLPRVALRCADVVPAYRSVYHAVQCPLLTQYIISNNLRVLFYFLAVLLSCRMPTAGHLERTSTRRWQHHSRSLSALRSGRYTKCCPLLMAVCWRTQLTVVERFITRRSSLTSPSSCHACGECRGRRHSSGRVWRLLYSRHEYRVYLSYHGHSHVTRY